MVTSSAMPAPDDEAALLDLLEKTSRTFALAIPQLPPPTVREVTVAYLLFRIADTFEDATVLWSRSHRAEALQELGELLDSLAPEEAVRLAERWSASPPIDHDGYRELLRRTPLVVKATRQLSPPARRLVVDHTLRTASGMAGFVRRADADGVLRLRDLQDLRDYCYVVAGIVGELLTELFLLGRAHLERTAGHLRERARLFGEALQLVNILKDAAGDSTEGRNYVPPALDRGEVFALARRDLEAAQEYCDAVQEAGGPAGIVAFTSLPVGLAWATLDRVESRGPGAKLTRPEVFRIHRRIERAIAAGGPVFGTS